MANNGSKPLPDADPGCATRSKYVNRKHRMEFSG